MPSTADQLTHIAEAAIAPMYALTLLLLLWEMWASRQGWARVGWGGIGLLLLVNAIGGASLCAIALRAYALEPKGVVGSAVELDIWTLVASIGVGGLGSNLLAHGLTSIRPRKETR